MSAPDVVGLGFTSWDRLGRVPRMPTLDEGAPLLEFSEQGGGPVAQALVTLSRLGVSTSYIGRVGDDTTARLMCDDLAREGVAIDRVQVTPNAISQNCIILVDDATGKRSICASRGDAGDVVLGDADRALIRSARLLHLDGHSTDAAIEAARLARSAGIPVCLDAGYPGDRVEELVREVTILIAGERLADSIAPDHDYALAAARLRSLGPEIVVVTLGEHGSYTLTDDGGFHTPAFQVRAVDTTGAGDVFHGAWLFGWLRGFTLEDNATVASACAAMKCRSLGGRRGIPRLPELRAFLVEHDRPVAALAQLSG